MFEKLECEGHTADVAVEEAAGVVASRLGGLHGLVGDSVLHQRVVVIEIF